MCLQGFPPPPLMCVLHLHVCAHLWMQLPLFVVISSMSHPLSLRRLQEVQGDHYESMLKPALETMGYEATFKTKTREAMGMAGKVIHPPSLPLSRAHAVYLLSCSSSFFSCLLSNPCLPAQVDGCALIWRRSKFRLSGSIGLEFNEIARQTAIELAGGDSGRERDIMNRLAKDNIAQVLIEPICLVPLSLCYFP